MSATKEEAMNLLVSTFSHGTVQVWEAATFIAATAIARAAARKRKSVARIRASKHTLRDIGVQPGALTWLPVDHKPPGI